MDARRQHAATVVGVVVAGVLASIVVPGPYNFGSSLVGATLLGVLVGYGEPPKRDADCREYGREALGYGAALAFVLLLTLGSRSMRSSASRAGMTAAARPRTIGRDRNTPMLGDPSSSGVVCLSSSCWGSSCAGASSRATSQIEMPRQRIGLRDVHRRRASLREQASRSPSLCCSSA